VLRFFSPSGHNDNEDGDGSVRTNDDTGEYMDINDGKFDFSDGDELTKVLKDKLADNAEIDLNGCYTDKLAKETSKIFPKAKVTGARWISIGRSDGRNRTKGRAWNVIPRTYKNGKKQ